MTTILIVDDLDINLLLLEAILSGQGFTVISSGNGVQALEIARRTPPDLVISDVLMPIMDGFTLCREWHSDDRLKSIPFVFYTATYTEPMDEELALSLGAVRYISKPIEPARFIEIIEEVLENIAQHQTPSIPAQLDQEKTYYQRYSQALVRRLEAKMLALEAANRRLETLYEVSTQLAKLRPGSSPVLFALNTIVETMGYTFAQFFTFNEALDELVLTEGVGLPDDVFESVQHLLRFRRGEERGLVGWVAQTREPLVIRDTRSEPRWITVDEAFRSAFFVPVLNNDELLGVLGVLSTDVDAFEEQEMRNMAILANNIAISVRNSTLVGELLASNSQLRKVNQAIEQSAGAVVITDPQGQIEYVNPAFEKITGYSQEEALGQGTNFLKSGKHPEPFYQNLWETILSGKVWKGEIVNRKKSGDIYHEEQTIAPILEPDGEISGFVAIKHDITSRVEAERATQRQLDRIASLHAIDVAINASMDLTVILNIVLEQVVERLEVDAAVIFLLEPHNFTLRYAAGRGFRTGAMQTSKTKVGVGLAGAVAQERRTVIEPDLLSIEDRFVRRKLLAGESFVSYAGIPLITKGSVKGILEVFHRSAKTFEEEWLSFLHTIAGQAAIAIDNAELFNNLQRSNLELRLAYDATIEGWSRALDLRDNETIGHSRRVTELAVQVADIMGMGESEIVHIRRGALLHDIGKLGIPDKILQKPGPLTEEEWTLMRNHPIFAVEMLQSIDHLNPAMDIPFCHHEKWDGSGYPRGLAGEQIPLSARIFAVVDVWDALLSERPYRSAWTKAEAAAYLRENAGTHFDPQVVDVFLKVIV